MNNGMHSIRLSQDVNDFSGQFTLCFEFFKERKFDWIFTGSLSYITFKNKITFKMITLMTRPRCSFLILNEQHVQIFLFTTTIVITSLQFAVTF